MALKMAARQRLNKRLLQDLRLLLSHFVTYVCGPRSFWPNLKTIMAYLTGLLKPVQSIRKKMPSTSLYAEVKKIQVKASN